MSGGGEHYLHFALQPKDTKYGSTNFPGDRAIFVAIPPYIRVKAT